MNTEKMRNQLDRGTDSRPVRDRELLAERRRLGPVIRSNQVHFLCVALMGTPKHLREVHGMTEVPTDPRELARLHVEAHAPGDAGIAPPEGGAIPGRCKRTC